MAKITDSMKLSNAKVTVIIIKEDGTISFTDALKEAEGLINDELYC